MFLDMGRLFVSAVRRTWPLIILVLVVFSLGVALGAMGVRGLPGQEVDKMNEYINSFISSAVDLEADGAGVLLNSLFDSIVVVVFLYLLGITVIGIPVILAFILMRGYILGFALYFLITEMSARGLLLSLTSILPQSLIFVPALLVGGVTSLWFSLLMVNRFMDSRVRIGSSFVKYTLVMAGVFAAAAAAAAVESYVTPWLTRSAAGIIDSGAVGPGIWFR
ncbi:MAG: stage II sporulation protein M [Bacillota bacterium]